MLAPLVVLFIAVPILELFLILQVGEAIGVLPTVGLLIADSILGGVLMRSQGRAAWRRFNAAVAEGRVPGREVIDGALVILGGALLLTPGFFTDAFGLALLLPPTRAVIRRLLLRRFEARIVAGVAAPGPGAFGPRPPGARGPRSGPHERGPDRRFDVEGTATDLDSPPRERP